MASMTLMKMMIIMKMVMMIMEVVFLLTMVTVMLQLFDINSCGAKSLITMVIITMVRCDDNVNDDSNDCDGGNDDSVGTMIVWCCW